MCHREESYYTHCRHIEARPIAHCEDPGSGCRDVGKLELKQVKVAGECGDCVARREEGKGMEGEEEKREGEKRMEEEVERRDGPGDGSHSENEPLHSELSNEGRGRRRKRIEGIGSSISRESRRNRREGRGRREKIKRKTKGCIMA